MTQVQPQGTQQFLAQALAQVGDAIIIIDSAEHVAYLNARAAAQYGVEETEALGKPLSYLHTHRWPQPDGEQAAYTSLAEHGYWRGENIHILHDGRQLHVESTVTALKDAAGQPAGLMAVIRDITAQKATEAALQELNNTLEERVAERTAELEHSNRELERSNRELDRFAYIASHDLKSPLRAIDNLAQWIAEDSAGALPPTAQVHLTKLRSRVKRLETLLDDLLAYSRAGRRRYSLEAVDTLALTQAVAKTLDLPAGFQVRIVGDMPTVSSARPPLESVLRNLLQNAIRHHHRAAEGVATVTAQRRDHLIEFCVSDNGPGIAPQYHERIFEVFQTLRPRDEVEGSGMGLAIVKKTVESAGGRAWVESTEGQGAAFHFTWPAGA